MRHKSLDLIGTIAIACIAMALTWMNDANWILHAVFGLPLAIFLPGYALVALVFRRRTIEFAMGLLFSIGLSLAVSALGGLVLDWTPWGLRPGTWSVLLGSITIVSSLIALRQRRMYSIAMPMPLAIGLHIKQILLLVLSVLIVASSIQMARQGVFHQPTKGFTQLWAVADQSDQRTIVVGMRNFESNAEAVTYKVQVEDKDAIIQVWPTITLGSGEQWQTNYTLPPTISSKQHIAVSLYRLDAPNRIYRHIVLGQ